MISKYIREEQSYTQQQLQNDVFECSEDEVVRKIKNLKARNILSIIRKSAEDKETSVLSEKDTDIEEVKKDDKEHRYKFTFVGIININEDFLICYPKYIHSSKKPVKEIKKILKVIEKCNHSERQLLNILDGNEGNKSPNLFLLIKYLLNDYYEYGLYNSSQNIVELDGDGDILWGKTVDEMYPVINKNRPYYLDLYTRKSIDNNLDFFYQLHRAVITDCSKQISGSDIAELFDFEPIELTEDRIEDFGEIDYIIEKIDQELTVQFNTQKQELLRAIRVYILTRAKKDEGKINNTEDNIELFGTNTFYTIWEKVCQKVFNDLLEEPIRKIPDINSPESDKLKTVIEKAVWYLSDNSEPLCNPLIQTPVKSGQLIPDLVTIEKNQLIILDAKYYDLSKEGKELKGNPGIESITKQYLYQLAFKQFVRKYNLKEGGNYFILPTEMEIYIYRGNVQLGILNDVGLKDIHIFQIPSEEIFDYYLSNQTIKVEEKLGITIPPHFKLTQNNNSFPTTYISGYFLI